MGDATGRRGDSEGREGRKGGGDYTTTQRRDEKAGVFRFLVLGRESRLRLGVVWIGLCIFWTGTMGLTHCAQDPLPFQKDYSKNGSSRRVVV